jgi:hypothetical protein
MENIFPLKHDIALTIEVSMYRRKVSPGLLLSSIAVCLRTFLPGPMKLQVAPWTKSPEGED